jgi:hypothetical protein
MHRWKFSTVGGVRRVKLSSGADLVHLASLDQKLWTALSCPVNGLEIDANTLALIDFDGDGKIRVPEILAAVSWLVSLVKNPDELLQPESSMPLASINDSHPEGKRLLATAKIILHNLGCTSENSLSVSQTSDLAAIFAHSRFNGDGLITRQSCESPEQEALLGEIMSCIGHRQDLSALPGIGQSELNDFFDAITAYLDWQQQKEDQSATILPFGEHTETLASQFQQLEAKIDDYFMRCRLAAYDEASTLALNLQTERVAAISHQSLHNALEEIATYPLCKIVADQPLPLDGRLNPAWEARIGEWSKLALPGKKQLSENDWQAFKAKMGPYLHWKAAKKGENVEQLGIDRLKTLQQGQLRAELEALIQADLDLADEAEAVKSVDKLVRLYRDLFRLLQNFVTFYDFYAQTEMAIFQAGTLYIDQRSTTLCMKVNDMNRHNKLVVHSGMYLLYCQCTAKHSNEQMVIVAALTNGDTDNLEVGRNALFYDRLGRDWDATIVRIVENPISIRQAFWAPYRKVSRFIEQQINKFASDQEQKTDASLSKGVSETVDQSVQSSSSESSKAAAPFDIGKFVGIFAAISLALGALGTALASVIGGFLGLVWWKMPIALAGIMLLISGPSMLLAYLKLRKRNLAPLLDANGWAVNARATVNIQFGKLLTQLAEVPLGSDIDFRDPFARKKRPFLPLILLLGLLLGAFLFAWLWGWIKF